MFLPAATRRSAFPPCCPQTTSMNAAFDSTLSCAFSNVRMSLLARASMNAKFRRSAPDANWRAPPSQFTAASMNTGSERSEAEAKRRASSLRRWSLLRVRGLRCGGRRSLVLRVAVLLNLFLRAVRVRDFTPRLRVGVSEVVFATAAATVDADVVRCFIDIEGPPIISVMNCESPRRSRPACAKASGSACTAARTTSGSLRSSLEAYCNAVPGPA